MRFSGQSRKVKLGAQDTVFVDRRHHLYTNKVNSMPTKRELRISVLSLKKYVLIGNSLELVYARLLASIVGQRISLSVSCGSVTQIMTRYLLMIINSRRSWNSKVSLSIEEEDETFCSGKTI